MKKAFALLLAILSYGQITTAQNDLSETERLAATAKIWGFLKYYHPAVAEGKFNWDEQLFAILPQVKQASNKKDLSLIIEKWIDDLGPVPECKKCKDEESGKTYFDKNFNLGWINDNRFFTEELSGKLNYIKLNRHQGTNYYVTANSRVGNISLKNEHQYADNDWGNEDIRVLSLFRYWNIIEYFYPYKYMTDMPWDEVLAKMIPIFQMANTEIEFQLAILELIVHLDDSHGGYVSELTNNYFGFYWAPVKFTLKEGKAIITGYWNEAMAKSSDLRIGDAITKVNNRPVEEIYREKEKYIPGSNEGAKRGMAHYAIFNGSTDSVNIEFIRENEIQLKTVKRHLFKNFKYEGIHNEKYKILEGNIGYINMGEIENDDVDEAMKSLKDTRGIIFDIRNYPKGTLYSFANYLNSKKKPFFKVTYPDLNYPGKFIWRDGILCGKRGGEKYKNKVVLLVNEKTQSHAEFTAMCLQTGDHAITIGSQTSGADGNVSTIEMAGGSRTYMSGIGIFYPDNTETQRKGVKIDIDVQPSIEGLLNGRDEVLERAVKIIKDRP